MNYSKLHKSFADSLNHFYSINEQDVLDFPQKYLGPNYKEVLNWWFYWESFNDEQLDVYGKRRSSLDHKSRVKAHYTAEELANEVIVPIVVNYLDDEGLELISSHLYLERNIPFTFLPLIFDL
jgi:hypothetical protein